MTKSGRRLVEDFLLPSLNNKTYDERLKWIDKENKLFSIRWSHKNAAKWSLDDTIVFQDWDKMKGHYHPEVKGYYMQAKQRFRAALYKLNTIKKLHSMDKYTKLYQLVPENDKKRTYEMSLLDEPGQKPIHVPVICENAGYKKPLNSELGIQESKEGVLQIKMEECEQSKNSDTSDCTLDDSSSDSCNNSDCLGNPCSIKTEAVSEEESIQTDSSHSEHGKTALHAILETRSNNSQPGIHPVTIYRHCLLSVPNWTTNSHSKLAKMPLDTVRKNGIIKKKAEITPPVHRHIPVQSVPLRPYSSTSIYRPLKAPCIHPHPESPKTHQTPIKEEEVKAIDYSAEPMDLSVNLHVKSKEYQSPNIPISAR